MTAQRLDAGHPATAALPARAVRRSYLALLTWAFTVFNSVRVFAYLPTPWAIHVHGDSSQHSLLTWLTWLGANATMAAWLYEHNGGRADRLVPALTPARPPGCAGGPALQVVLPARGRARYRQ